MVIEEFSSKIIFLDTALLIYFIEGQNIYQDILYKLFDFNDKGDFSFITSSITILEVLVKPLREGKTDLAKQYKNILTKASGIEVLDVTPSIAEIAAQLRAQYNLKTPDAIQLATAIEEGADFFLTNDNKLKAISNIKVVTIGEIEV